MRLLIKRGHSLVNDLRFSNGPVYIGRQPKCQVFLPDRTVSRQHAVLFSGQNDDNWEVQDLESANCTTLNGRPISKMPLHEGDVIGIADFAIEVHFETQAIVTPQDKPVDLGDTIIDAKVNIPSVHKSSRQAGFTIHVNSQYLKKFYQLNVALFNKTDQDAMLAELTDVLLKQFQAYHVWAGLRETASGALTCHCGRSRGGSQISLEGLLGKGVIKEALQSENFILLPNIADFLSIGDSHAPDMGNIKSALAAPIVAPAGVYGVIYIDNGIDHQPYTNQDLDYLTLVSTQVAAMIEHVG